MSATAFDMNANLCALPVELKELILSHIERIEAHHILALSSTFQEAFSLLRALPRPLDFEGVKGDIVRLLVVRLLDNDRVRSLKKERALELIGVHKDRLCEYACVQRNFEVLKWARNDLGLPWATTSCTRGYPVLYPAEPVSDDVLVLRMLRDTWPTSDEPYLVQRWPENERPEVWCGVTMENGRVVKLDLDELGLTGAVPAKIGRLSALRELNLGANQLTSLPAEIGQLTSLTRLDLGDNYLTSLPPEIGLLTSLERLNLFSNELTSLPAEIGQLRSLKELDLNANYLTSLQAEIGQLRSLKELDLGDIEHCDDRWHEGNLLSSLPAEIGQLTALKRLYLDANHLPSLPPEIRQLTALETLKLGANQLTSLPAEIWQLPSLKVLFFSYSQLSSLPAEIGQLTSLRELHLRENELTSLPAEIWQLTSLRELDLRENQLTSVSAVIRKLRAAGCQVHLDDAVTVDE